MRGILKRYAAPSVEPVTLAEVKARLRVGFDDDDDDLTAMIKAAVAYLDGPAGVLKRCLVEQTWDYVLPRFYATVELPLAPFRSIVSISYLDTDAATQTLDTADYRVIERGDDEFSELLPPRDGDWPDTVSDEPEAVTIRFKAGYAPTSASPADYRENIPADLKTAIMLMVGGWYENREEVMPTNWQITDAAWRLIRPKRLTWL